MVDDRPIGGTVTQGRVKAVIELEVPLDVPDDAPDGDKLQATIEVLDNLNVPDRATAAVHWTDVDKPG
jgi:hypothetical protein